MKENTYKFDEGHIKYRYPTIFEAMRLIAKLGVDPEGKTSVSEFEMAAIIMESLQPYITELSYENKVMSWEEISCEYKLIPHLQNVGLDVINSVQQQDNKRQKRKK